MPDVVVPLVDGSSELFRNEDGSGWMLAGDCEFWRMRMAKEGPVGNRSKYRDEARRHKPAYNVKAAVLMTGGSRGDAEEQATIAWNDASEDWRRKNGVGRWVDQFKRHFVWQHTVGTYALAFIPYIGPLASAIAKSQTPAVEAAERRAIAEHEKYKVEEKFREDYFKALDAYIRGENENFDASYLEYHAKVIVPAAWDIKNQLTAGFLDLDDGRVWLGEDGMFRWENGQVVDMNVLLNENLTEAGYGTFLGWFIVPWKTLVREVKNSPVTVVISMTAGIFAWALTNSLLSSERRT